MDRIIRSVSFGKFIVVAATVSFIGLIGGYYLGKTEQIQTPEEEQIAAEKQFAFVNPLRDQIENESLPLLTNEVESLKNKVDEMTTRAIDAGQVLSASIYYRDLNNGPWFSTGEENLFRPASLFKVPLMIAFFKVAETDPEILNKVVTYEKPFENVAQHNVASSNIVIEVGRSYTIIELIEHMVIYSDNLAAYLLLENIDPAIVTKVFNDLSVPTTELYGPRKYASFLRILYNGTYLESSYSEKALEILSRSTFSHGMRAVLVPGVKASIKYGIATEPTGKKQLHECGIVYWHTDRPHILCIMTAGTDYDEMALFIQEATSIVQDAILKTKLPE